MIDSLKLAIKFHDTYERLAPSFGYETRKETKIFDPFTPNGQLMLAVCQEVGDYIEKSAFNAGFEAAILQNHLINSKI